MTHAGTQSHYRINQILLSDNLSGRNLLPELPKRRVWQKEGQTWHIKTATVAFAHAALEFEHEELGVLKLARACIHVGLQ